MPDKNELIDAAGELGRDEARRMASRYRLTVEAANWLLEFPTSTEPNGETELWERFSPPDEPPPGKGPIEALLNDAEPDTRCAIVSAYETALMFSWLEFLTEAARDVIADALDNTMRCELANACATCGGTDQLAAVTLEFRHLDGIACLTLCTACQAARRLPKLGPSQAIERELAHCKHLGISIEVMTGIARAQLDAA